MTRCLAEHLTVLLCDIQEKTVEETMIVLQTLFPEELEEAMRRVGNEQISITDGEGGIRYMTVESPLTYCSLPVPFCSCSMFQRIFGPRGHEGSAATLCAHIITSILLKCSQMVPSKARRA